MKVRWGCVGIGIFLPNPVSLFFVSWFFDKFVGGNFKDDFSSSLKCLKQPQKLESFDAEKKKILSEPVLKTRFKNPFPEGKVWKKGAGCRFRKSNRLECDRAKKVGAG